MKGAADATPLIKNEAKIYWPAATAASQTQNERGGLLPAGFIFSANAKWPLFSAADGADAVCSHAMLHQDGFHCRSAVFTQPHPS